MIGTAQAAYDDYAAYLRDQVSTYNRSRVAEHVTVQLKLAEAAQMVDIARLLVREDWKEAQRLIARGAQLPLIDRARWRRNGAYAAGCCVKAVDLIHSVCGARANYLDNALQRQHRDVHAAKHQIHLSWEINGAEFGRIAAGPAAEQRAVVGPVRFRSNCLPVIATGAPKARSEEIRHARCCGGVRDRYLRSAVLRTAPVDMTRGVEGGTERKERRERFQAKRIRFSVPIKKFPSFAHLHRHVMAGLVPAIHDPPSRLADMDARNKSGHDGESGPDE